MYYELEKYKEEDTEISTKTKAVLSRNLWYLSQQLAGLAFFDDLVTENEKIKMVKN